MSARTFICSSEKGSAVTGYFRHSLKEKYQKNLSLEIPVSLTNSLEKKSTTANVGSFALSLSLCTHSSICNWKEKYWTLVSWKMLAVAMKNPKRISFGMWPHLIHISATLCWYRSPKLQGWLFQLCSWKCFEGVIHDLFGNNQELGNELLARCWNSFWGKQWKIMSFFLIGSLSQYLQLPISIQRWCFACLVQPRVILLAFLEAM